MIMINYVHMIIYVESMSSNLKIIFYSRIYVSAALQDRCMSVGRGLEVYLW